MLRKLFALVLLFSAMSGPAHAFDRYIDRPYTLHKEQRQADLQIGYLAQNPFFNDGIINLLLAVDYLQPLEDDMELIWAPLPTGVRYRLRPLDGYERGVSWSLDFQELGRFGAKPTFSSYVRRNWSSDFAGELDFSYYVFIPFDQTPTSGSLELFLSPVWQLGPHWAMGPRVGLSSGDYYLLKTNKDGIPGGEPFDPRKSRFTAPVGFIADYRDESGWSAKLTYSYFGLSIDPNELDHVVLLQVSKIF